MIVDVIIGSHYPHIFVCVDGREGRIPLTENKRAWVAEIVGKFIKWAMR